MMLFHTSPKYRVDYHTSQSSVALATTQSLQK